MNTKLYTGNGGTQYISGLDFKPDWVWIKSRNVSNNHRNYDAVRGATKIIYQNLTNAEATQSNGLSAFNSDGFTLGDDGNSNSNNDTYASWNWKAGTTAIPSGSTTDPLGVSINTTSGFGIYKITSPGSGSYVLKHGLGKKPKMVIVKDLEASQKWMVWSDTFSNLTNDYLQLNDTAAKATYSTCWGTMNSTDCTISVGGTLDANNDHVVYIFTDTTGYCKHGSYTGNGNADGTFVYTGFKPAWLMVKNTATTSSWEIWDAKRNTFNPTAKSIFPDGAGAEYDYTNRVDLLSNGFKLKTTSDVNGSGNSIIYMAFAEAPLVGSNNVPCTAR